MPEDLYDRDFLIWSERQADLLRRLAAGERVNESLDFPNLIPGACPWSLDDLLAENAGLDSLLTKWQQPTP